MSDSQHSSTSPINIPLSDKMAYICDNINDLDIQYRKDILQMIYNTPDKDKIYEKGNGSQINLNQLPAHLVTSIYTFAYRKMQEQMIDMSVV